MTAPAIEAVNLTQRIAVLSNGTTVPITKMYGYDGEETDTPDQAVTFVAGSGDRWFAGLCKDYCSTVNH